MEEYKEKQKDKKDNIIYINRIWSLFLHLITGFISIIGILSLIFRISPLEFFRHTSSDKTLSVIYIILLYFLILLSIYFNLKKTGENPVLFLKLQKENLDISLLLMSFGVSSVLFSLYFVIAVNLKGMFIKFSPHLFRQILYALIMSFLFALVEEIFFRGYIFQNINKKYPFTVSSLASSSFFALLHLFRPGTPIFKLFYFTGLTLVGLILCRLLYKTRSLWIPVTVHTCWIAIMYLYPQVVLISEENYRSLEWLLGFNSTPVAGILGGGLIIITCIILEVFTVRNLKITGWTGEHRTKECQPGPGEPLGN